ncbi:MAG TPA: cytochrome c peroxidase [Gemmatimonadales bacterium]|nr:cytochrome c peroxidase [Gemmatimonadales bacterium]
MQYRMLFSSLVTAALLAAGCTDADPGEMAGPESTGARGQPTGDPGLDQVLRDNLAEHGFTGRIAATLETRLGRRIDRQLANLGRKLWFDPIGGLNNDNSCAGCHSPSNGLGDTQSIAIGIDNNGIVGPDRAGPRNQRRTPMAINTAFYPTLMWNSRFRALSGDPFDNSQGLEFPAPEGTSLSHLPHLLTAQAFIPPTERVEAAGFHVPGDNFALRDSVVNRLDATPEYRRLFGMVFGDIKAGAPITFDHVGQAIAEFEFTQVYANAPIDRYARGEPNALTPSQKRGAVLFFGSAGCVRCHQVAGPSNEMFSDFEQHVIGVPQVVPTQSNMVFDGPGANEDFGLEQVTGNPDDRYLFRTSPLRNVALQPAFMHNGAFVRLEDAIRHHLDPVTSATAYTPTLLDPDLQGSLGPIAPVLARLDPLLQQPILLSDQEFQDLVSFVREGLLDPAARPSLLRRLIPERLPSGMAPLTFQTP